MYAVNLMRLARLAGLRQTAIAKHLGVVRVVPNLWALGKRPIPEGTIAPLVAFIAKAVKQRLATAAPWDTIRADLTTALRDCFIENCQRHVEMEEPSLEAFMEEVEKYAALSQRQQQHGQQLEHMEKLSAAMLCWFEVEHALLPLRRLLPDEEVARPVADEEALTVQSKE